jgi:hypothetical protein
VSGESGQRVVSQARVTPTGHKILSSLTLRPGPTSAAAAAAAMLNNLAVSAGGLSLGGEMGHKKGGGEAVPRHQVCKFTLIVWVYGEIPSLSHSSIRSFHFDR